MDIIITLSKEQVKTVMKYAGLTGEDPWKLVKSIVTNQVRGFAIDTIGMIERDQKESGE